MNRLLNKQLEEFKARLTLVLQELTQVSSSIKHDEMYETSRRLMESVDEAFMFVIVGEVKSGKSSFVNALLDTGREICKVAASPMTDKIQQIVYGDSVSEQEINAHTRKISQNVDILKDITIVDTPGTNTIIEHHQEITEKFIPSSDLIVFVFEAKNPYRQSAWEFFNFIHSEWHKKIIFVLQQKDLMNDADLQTNLDGVKQTARQKGIMQAEVFAVSAKEEMESHKETSGFKALRNYIFENITGGKAAFLKLINSISTAQNIVNRIEAGKNTREKQLSYDLAFRKEISEKLEHQELKTKRHTDMLVENLAAAYENIMKKRKFELKENIGFLSLIKRSIGSVFGSSQDLRTWLEEFSKSIEEQLNQEFSLRLESGVGDISESIQDMAKSVDSRIRNSETILKDDHEIFSDIADKRSEILMDLGNTFKRFMEASENFYSDDMNKPSRALIPDMAKGSGLAVVGLIITTITNAAVFDITGGILTALGLSFAGITLGINKNNILKAYQKSVDEGKEKIESGLKSDLVDYTKGIRQRIEDNFYKFDKHLQDEKQALEVLSSKLNSLSGKLSREKESIQAAMPA